MANLPLVELRGLQKVYASGLVALDGVNASIRDGEFVSLLGPSGCGKSTVLRLIAGLCRPTAGEVMRAWDRTGERRSSQPLGCVFQEPTLLPWANVWRNVYLPLRLRGVRRRAARATVEEVLRLVGLEGFAGSYPVQLSGGMKMRVSVARALVTQPRLLLLDEPFAALDEITRNRLNDDLRSLWQLRRWGALFITHSVFEAVYLSTRVLIMSARPGRIVDEIAVDLPEERTLETRTTREYAELCRRASRALEEAAMPSNLAATERA